MRLTLSTIRCPPGTVPDRREADAGELTLGRGPENDWVLSDPTRHLSKRHCVLAWRDGGWQIADLSSNGTFLNDEPEPIGQGRGRPLRDGDRIRLGPYELEVRLEEDRAHPANPFEEEPFALAPGRAAPPVPPAAGSGFGLDEPERGPFAGPTQDDHAPVLSDHVFVPVTLPEDWDLEEGGPALAHAPAPAPSPPRPPAELPQTPLPAAAGQDLLAAFLAAAGTPDLRPADPAAMAQALGRAFRALVAGLRQVLIARAEIKAEFRIEQTMIRVRGNNPLKFSAGDEDALAALLGAGRRTDMDAPEAVADALHDIRLHELATMQAMLEAVRALLDSLAPKRILAASGGGGGLLPWQREARAWEAYEARHAETLQALADDFDSVFGKAFARAYERALREAEPGRGR